MTETERPTVVGVFEDRRQAERAVGELRRVGFRDEQVGLLVREGATGAPEEGCDTNTKAEEGMAVPAPPAIPIAPDPGRTRRAGSSQGRASDSSLARRCMRRFTTRRLRSSDSVSDLDITTDGAILVTAAED